MKYLFAGLIRIYRFFSKRTRGVCKFYPTCSQYAYTAILRFGVCYGGYLAVKRLFRCHPWSLGGIDPVPEKIHYPTMAQRRLKQVRKGK